MNVKLGICVGFSALTLHAATNVWDGGSATDNNWSSVENWNPDGAPVSASDTHLQFIGLVRVDPYQNIATPFVLNRLDFLGGATNTTAFTIRGSQLQFVTNGTTSPRIHLSRNASCVITNAIDIPAGTTLIADIGTYSVDFRGPITGDGSIDKNDYSGGLSFNNSSSTFSGGLIVRAKNDDWGKVNINASYAMGTGPISLYGGTMVTNKTNPGGLNFYNTTVHTNPIALFAHSPIFAAMPNGNNCNVTLNGSLDLNTYTLHLRGGGIGTINGVISEGNASALVKSDAGTWTLGTENTFTGKVTLLNGTLRLGTNNALHAAVPISFACVTSFASTVHATLDLNGRSQTISKLEGYTVQSWLTNIVTSTTNAGTLLIQQNDASLFNGRFMGALTVIKAGTGTLTLTNYPSTTTGDIIVSNGTLSVAAGASLGNATNVTVAAGTLALQASAAIADHATLAIADGGVVELNAAVAETVKYLYVNGIPRTSGSYGTTASGATFVDDIHFSGTQRLVVAQSKLTWTAAGGSDMNINTALNWNSLMAPAFNGTEEVTFGTAGTNAVMNVNASLYGITFNRDDSFTLAAGAGILSNGVGGITAAGPSAWRTYTIEEDLVLTSSQTWRVTTNSTGRSTLNITGKISDGDQPYAITKTDFGSLNLRSENTFSGLLTINEGDLNIYHPKALGNTNTYTVINGGMGGRLGLNGVVVEKPLVLLGERNNNGTLFTGSGSNVLAGPVICTNQVRFQASGSPLVFTGGVTADNNGLFVINSGSLVAFKDKPINIGTRTFWSDSGGLTLIAVSGNTWADMLVANGTVRCAVTNALCPTASIRIGVWYGSSGTLDLNGYDQTIGRLYMESALQSATRAITSSVPARLTVNQSSDGACDARFTGAVSLLKLGSGTLTLTNAFTSTTGSFVISNGTLSVGDQGTFGPNSKTIIVAGTGKLALSNSVAIADTATVSMPANGINTAKIHLADNVTETVGFLNFGTISKYANTYGSSESTAAIKDDDHFTGKGVLRVLFDRTATRIIIR